ncbi:hypothetical protein ROZALSC1DRAFT_31506 [Rozella allomycis CSF55]|uniref:Uncharacterized protein n=1 Tax=Rozella allomycis (strain CSF55) TaxID=988480 RepID=A0A075B188_ROZAC|nr:hypothetical protein O9G_005245 [Rozella allomycis CSF55]RKP16582.1 hypothetical protein ROZALSC1DRAFT_31506 [Rozella allomycis CSF55]|eukprot:EPZ36108.1 hypothetical protein O9G_005245 [Rozella allomycis CSF55]
MSRSRKSFSIFRSALKSSSHATKSNASTFNIENEYDFSFSIAIVGERGVGKSSLIKAECTRKDEYKVDTEIIQNRVNGIYFRVCNIFR